jgi:hypothetical protein
LSTNTTPYRTADLPTHKPAICATINTTLISANPNAYTAAFTTTVCYAFKTALMSAHPAADQSTVNFPYHPTIHTAFMPSHHTTHRTAFSAAH